MSNQDRAEGEFQRWWNSKPHRQKYSTDHPAYLAACEAWDAAMHYATAPQASVGGMSVDDLVAEWCKDPEFAAEMKAARMRRAARRGDK